MNRSCRHLVGGGLAAAVLLCFGCRTPPLPDILVMDSMQEGSSRPATHVDWWLAIREIATEDVTGPTLRVRLQAESVRIPEGANSVDFEYRFLWFDSGGFPVESLTSTWTTCRFQRGQTRDFVGVAPTREVKHYRFEIRYIRRV